MGDAPVQLRATNARPIGAENIERDADRSDFVPSGYSGDGGGIDIVRAALKQILQLHIVDALGDLLIAHDKRARLVDHGSAEQRTAATSNGPDKPSARMEPCD